MPHLTRGLLLAGLVHAFAAGATAQMPVRTINSENFRREPQGQILARVDMGTRLASLGTSGSWTEAAIEGWVWTASLQVTERDGFDLVVSASGGENLRERPSGPILARLEEGMLLEQVEQAVGWTRVRRAGWIWSASVETVDAVETVEAVAAPAPGPEPAAAGETGVAAPSRSTFVQLGRGTPILVAPGGDTLGVAGRGADVEMLGREGNWVRVRVEGWSWLPEVDEAVPGDVDEDGPAITPDLLLGPGGDAYLGRGVTWTLQFISLERAEAVRTDFFAGEPFLLGRYGGAEGPFVYVAVPPGRVIDVEGLMPLETVTVVGRVRSASSPLTNTPILDLLDIRRGPGR